MAAPAELSLPGPVRSAVSAVVLSWHASRGTFSLRVLVTVGAAIATPSAAWYGKLLVDELSLGNRGQLAHVVLYAVIGAVLVAAALLADQVLTYATARHEAAIALLAETDLFRQVCNFIGLRHFETPAFQDRLLMAEQSAADGPSSLTNSAQRMVGSVVSLAGFLFIIAGVWPLMALLLFAAAVPGVVAEIKLANQHVRASATVSTHERQRFFYRSLLTDDRAAKEVRLFGLGAFFLGRQIDALRKSQNVMVRLAGRTAVIQSCLGLLGAVLSGVGVAVVAGKVMSGSLTPGDVVLFLAAVAGVQGGLSAIVGEIGRISQTIKMFQHYLAVIRSPLDLQCTDRPAPRLKRSLRFDDVWFRYDPSGPWILRGVSFELPVGTSLGLVGLNGAGKSTVVKLICRFYDAEHGHIFWDGTDIREFDPQTLRHRLAATFQDYMTYDLPVGENIGVGELAKISDLDHIRRCAQLADIDQAIGGLPRGYATMLSRMFMGEVGDEPPEAGVDLSGGQWQRVALARALMRDAADLLILDEPSSGLDAEAEHRMHQTLRDFRGDKTALLISHRMGSIREADHIVVLEGGTVREQGTHSQLVGAGGIYARLFQTQASGYQEHLEREPVEVLG